MARGVGRRLRKLDERVLAPREDPRAREVAELKGFLARLTDEELHWVCEPMEEATGRVTCPQHGGEADDCHCRAAGRTEAGLEAHPDLREEYARRWRLLFERREEIMAREPVVAAQARRARRRGAGGGGGA